MAFNFGAFAGGLATGIQKAQELALRQQQLEQQAKKEANDKAIAEQKLMNDKIEKDRKAIIDSNKEIMESKKVLGDKNLPLDVRIETSNAHIRTARSMNPNLNISETGMFNYSGKRWITDAETSDIVGQYINDFGEEGTIKVEDKTGNILKRDSDNGEWYSIGKARPASSFENQEALKKSDFIEVNIGGKKVGMPISTYNDLYNKGKAPELWVKTSDKATGYDIGLSGSMSESEINYFTNKGINPDNVSRLTLQAYRKYEMAGEKKTDFDKRIEFINQQGNIIQGVYDGTKDIKDVSKTDIGKLRTAERLSGDKGLGETEKKFIRDSEQTLATGKRLVNTLSAIGNEEIERGLIDNVKATAYKLFSDKAWEGLSEEDKKKQLLTIGVNTKIGNALAQYIKSISGTAVAQDEYDRLLRVFATGDYSNIQSLKQSINTFYDDLAEAHATRLKDNLLEGGSFILDKLKTHRDRFGNKKPIEQKATTEKDMAMQTLKSSDKGDIASGLDVIYDEKAVNDYYANKENPSYTPSFENKIDINGTETRLQDALDLYSSGYFDKVDIYVKDYNTGEVNLYQKGKAPNKLKNSIVSKEAYIEILDRIAYGGTKKQTSKYSNAFR